MQIIYFIYDNGRSIIEHIGEFVTRLLCAFIFTVFCYHSCLLLDGVTKQSLADPSFVFKAVLAISISITAFVRVGGKIECVDLFFIRFSGPSSLCAIWIVSFWSLIGALLAIKALAF